MKTILKSFAAAGLFAALSVAQTTHYNVLDLGTLPGGKFSQPASVNNRGVVAGVTTGLDGTQRAALWYTGLGLRTDIGTRGGLNSFAFGANELGQAIVQAETADKDPNNENFCAYGTGLKCLAFLWQDGVMTLLPTLGGNNATVGNINNRGEVPGLAETATRDPLCPSGVTVAGTGPQFLDYEAVVWGPGPGSIRKLALLSGDTVGEALWINDNSQATGASGTCANTVLPPFAFGLHAVLWEKDGSATDLGSLGGTVDAANGVGNIGLSINNPGQVVGASAIPGNTTTHAFLWTRGTGMRDLGTLPGDFSSAGTGVNDAGTVVGPSFDAMGDPRAFVWQNGVMNDLNAISSGASLYLLFGGAINAGGEIVGFGATSTGDIHAFLAIPSSGSSAHEREPVVLSEDVRKALRQFTSRRYHSSP